MKSNKVLQEIIHDLKTTFENETNRVQLQDNILQNLVSRMRNPLQALLTNFELWEAAHPENKQHVIWHGLSGAVNDLMRIGKDLSELVSLHGNAHENFSPRLILENSLIELKEKNPSYTVHLLTPPDFPDMVCGSLRLFKEIVMEVCSALMKRAVSGEIVVDVSWEKQMMLMEIFLQADEMSNPDSYPHSFLFKQIQNDGGHYSEISRLKTKGWRISLPIEKIENFGPKITIPDVEYLIISKQDYVLRALRSLLRKRGAKKIFSQSPQSVDLDLLFEESIKPKIIFFDGDCWKNLGDKLLHLKRLYPQNSTQWILIGNESVPPTFFNKVFSLPITLDGLSSVLGISKQSLTNSEEIKSTNSDLTGLKLLLVEDSDIDAIYLQNVAASSGLDVHRVSDVQQALAELMTATLDGAPFDFAILDYQLPDGNGIELAKQVVQNAQIRPVQMILLTGRSDLAQGHSAIEAGIVGFLAKPITAQGLIDYINLFVKRQQKNLIHKKHRVLVVEDDLVNQRALVGMLEHIGFIADVCSKDLSDFSVLGKMSYSAVLFDCGIPDETSIELAKKIRQNVANHSSESITRSGNGVVAQEHETRHGALKKNQGFTPIIAMTAIVTANNYSVDQIFDDYVVKPFSYNEIKSKLEKWLQ